MTVATGVVPAGESVVDALVASAVGPSVDMEPTPVAAAPPSIGLLTSATDVTALLDARYGPGRWLNGFSFEPEVAAISVTGDFPLWWVCPEAGGDAAVTRAPSNTKQVPDKPSNVTVRPFTAYVADPCVSTMDMDGRDSEARARRALDANLPRILENELWTGRYKDMALFTNPALADSTVNLVSGQIVGYVSALEELEQALADRDNRDGMIHATRRLVTLWAQNGLVTPSPTGKQLRTVLGTTVVPGVGYPGTGPLDQAATRAVQWAYATGPVMFARSQTKLQTANIAERVAFRVSQDHTVFAEADVVAFWDNKVNVNVKVDLSTAIS